MRNSTKTFHPHLHQKNFLNVMLSVRLRNKATVKKQQSLRKKQKKIQLLSFIFTFDKDNFLKKNNRSNTKKNE